MNNNSEEKKLQKFVSWVDGSLEDKAEDIEKVETTKVPFNITGKFSKTVYAVMSVLLTLAIIVILLMVVNDGPKYGDPENPTINEVSERYIEKSIEETGAVNTVAGMILDYRAFDTFGEAAMLFTAAMASLALLQKSLSKEEE